MAAGAPLCLAAPTEPGAPRAAQRRCPECPQRFAPKAWNQLFCCDAHKQAWANRWTARGRVIAQLDACARATRDGTRGDTATGKRAAADHNQLIRRYADEDQAAGRMPIVEFMRLRYAAGYEALT